MKLFLAGSAAVSITVLLYTLNRQLKDLAALISDPQAAQRNPKLAAYMFAGRAFGYGSALAITSTLTIGFLIALAVGAEDMKDFSQKTTAILQKTFPRLRGEVIVDSEGEAAFMQEWDKGVDERDVKDGYKERQAVFKKFL